MCQGGHESTIAIVFVVFLAWPSASLGQPAGAQAEMLFRQGRDLLAAGKVAEACSAFEESQPLELALVFGMRCGPDTCTSPKLIVSLRG